MPFVVVDQVSISNMDTAVEGLHAGLIPFVKQAPGFVRGTWSADRENGRGIGFMVFDTREHADAAVKRMQDEGSPPSVQRHCTIREPRPVLVRPRRRSGRRPSSS